MDSETPVVRTLSDPLIARSNSGPLADFIDVEVGDMCEAVMVLKVRTAQDFMSEIVGQLPVGSTFQVTEVGLNGRIKVSNDSVAGWISYKTDLDQPLIKKAPKRRNSFIRNSVTSNTSQGVLDAISAATQRAASKGTFNIQGEQLAPSALPRASGEFAVGDRGETLVDMHLRDGESFTSKVMAKLPLSTLFEVTEVGANNRIKVTVGGMNGWISAKADLGQPLVRAAALPKKRNSLRVPGGKLPEDCGSVSTAPSATSLPESIPSQPSGSPEDHSFLAVPAAPTRPAAPYRPGQRPAPAPAPWLRLLCCRV